MQPLPSEWSSGRSMAALIGFARHVYRRLTPLQLDLARWVEPPPAMVARKLDDDVRHLCASPASTASRYAEVDHRSAQARVPPVQGRWRGGAMAVHVGCGRWSLDRGRRSLSPQRLAIDPRSRARRSRHRRSTAVPRAGDLEAGLVRVLVRRTARRARHLRRLRDRLSPRLFVEALRETSACRRRCDVCSRAPAAMAASRRVGRLLHPPRRPSHRRATLRCAGSSRSAVA
jgi:hypothetical protein